SSRAGGGGGSRGASSSRPTTNVGGTCGGRKTNEPGPASMSSSPHRNRTCPPSTQNDSSSRWCTWSGGDAPAGTQDSTRPNAPPVDSAVALTTIRFGWNQVASPSPSPAANGVAISIVSTVRSSLFAQLCIYCADV